MACGVPEGLPWSGWEHLEAGRLWPGVGEAMELKMQVGAGTRLVRSRGVGGGGDFWGFSGGGPVQRPGAGLLSRLPPPLQHSLRSPQPGEAVTGAPGNIPLERRLTDLSPQCHPAQPVPHTRGVICFHRERCPSGSPSSQLRAGRAGPAGRRSCFLPRTNDLGPEREQLG